MSDRDRIGNHGEFLFQALITRRCYNRFFFHPIHMGEKHPTTDMVIELFDPTGVRAFLYASVKSTTMGYTGSCAERKLNVSVTESDVEALKQYPGPTYLAGMDVVEGRGY